MERMDRPKVSGYRKLSDDEALLMNEAKEAGEALMTVHAKIKAHVAGQRHTCHTALLASERSEESARLDNAEPERWLAMARTDIQVGVMKLVRAVAQPTGGV